MNYRFQISRHVTPEKQGLLALPEAAGQCQTAKEGEPGCADLCAAARRLAEERTSVLEFVRSAHPTGALAAQLLDMSRGVEQGTARIDDLFTKKSCVDVLKSVDKSNMYVNYFSFAIFMLTLIGILWALAHLLEPNHLEGPAESS